MTAGQRRDFIAKERNRITECRDRLAAGRDGTASARKSAHQLDQHKYVECLVKAAARERSDRV
jgi:hypothetical protein